jgi:hypothetical protein
MTDQLRRNPYLSRCQPISDKNNCQAFIIHKVHEYANSCQVDLKKPDGYAKNKEELCSELQSKYKDETEKDRIINQKLREQLNSVYYNMFFKDKLVKAGLLKKFFFGQELEKNDQKKREFINTYISIYSEIDNSIAFETNYKILDPCIKSRN